MKHQERISSLEAKIQLLTKESIERNIHNYAKMEQNTAAIQLSNLQTSLDEIIIKLEDRHEKLPTDVSKELASVLAELRKISLAQSQILMTLDSIEDSQRSQILIQTEENRVKVADLTHRVNKIIANQP